MRTAARVAAGTLVSLVLGLGPVATAYALARPTAPMPAGVVVHRVDTAPRASSRVLVIAHRGFSDIAPENTVPAMRAAAAAGADLVEFDVQRTADGHLIVVHDSTFARTTDVARVFPRRAADPVGSFTLAEVRRLDAGSWKGPQFVGVRVPTLTEVFAAVRPTRSGLLLELKDPSLYPGMETRVAHDLDAQGFIRSGRVIVHSFDAASLEAFHDAAPSVPVGLITEDGTRALASGQDTWLSTINPTTETVTDAAVVTAHTRHLKVFAWPLAAGESSVAQVTRLVNDGVDGIITDNPILVRHEIVVAQAQSGTRQVRGGTLAT
jgi:glycerophosphoryl diester phosphodiesterase